ncbi:MAG: TetR family transcriptional regulator [bacterium]|nr:TetR family transcriptional regulator [bacterium]
MTDVKEKIFKAALEAFSSEGFGGTRMDKIAKAAGVNKAMLFYYFSSKEGLYNEVLKNVVLQIFSPMAQLLEKVESAKEFLQELPKIQVSFLSKNQQFVRIVSMDLMRSPHNIKGFFKEFLKDRFDKGPGKLLKKVEIWHDNGEITETEPIHFVMNAMSLVMFTFIGKPIFEAIFNMEIEETEEFYTKRIASISNVLVKGMVK